MSDLDTRKDSKVSDLEIRKDSKVSSRNLFSDLPQARTQRSRAKAIFCSFGQVMCKSYVTKILPLSCPDEGRGTLLIIVFVKHIKYQNRADQNSTEKIYQGDLYFDLL